MLLKKLGSCVANIFAQKEQYSEIKQVFEYTVFTVKHATQNPEKQR